MKTFDGVAGHRAVAAGGAGVSGAAPAEGRPLRIAVDIGGTFTDLQILDARDGSVRAWKTPTTPEDPSEGLMTGVREAAGRFGFRLAEVGLLMGL